jgi:hypothetical protein
VREAWCGIVTAALLVLGLAPLAAAARAPGAPEPVVTGIDAGGGPWVGVFDAPGCVRVRNPVDPVCGNGFLAYFDFSQGGLNVATADVDGDGDREIVAAPGWAGRGDVRVVDGAGKPVTELTATPSGTGVRVAAADVNGDGRDEIVTSDDRGSPNVAVFDAVSHQRLASLGVFDAPTGEHDVRVAAGDVNGDGRDEIVAAYGPGDEPRVSILSAFNGQFVATPLRSFLAFEEAMRTGLEVATADLTGDRLADLVVAAITPVGPQVRMFDGGTGAPIGAFAPFGSASPGSLRIATGDVDGDGLAEIVAAVDGGSGPQVGVFDRTGARLALLQGFGLHQSIAVGDLDGDGAGEIVLGAGPGREGRVRVLDGDGELTRTFDPFPPTFQNGVRVAAGDLDGDGETRVVTGQGPGGDGEVTVFGEKGDLVRRLVPFEGSQAGVFVATGDLDGDRDAEVVAGADAGIEPLVRAYDAAGRPVLSFLARESGYRGGIRVATGDLDGDGKAEIVTGAGADGPARVRVFGGDGTLRTSFDAFGAVGRGVWVATGDLDGDGLAEILVGTGAGSEPLVRVFDARGEAILDIAPYERSFAGDVHVAAADVDGDGAVEIVTGPGRQRQVAVRAFTPEGRLVAEFLADNGYRGGIFVAARGQLGPRLALRSTDAKVVEGGAAQVQATLTDSSGALAAGDVAARALWSDGVVTDALVAGSGRVVVTARRRITRGTDLKATFRVSDRLLRRATAVALVAVDPASLRVRAPELRRRALRVSGAVAFLDDGNRFSAARDFRVRVAWGDGGAGALRVVRTAPGRYRLQGTHVYGRRGSYRAVVTVRDVDGTVRRAAFRVVVG